jgi:hypothetical protein
MSHRCKSKPAHISIIRSNKGVTHPWMLRANEQNHYEESTSTFGIMILISYCPFCGVKL